MKFMEISKDLKNNIIFFSNKQIQQLLNYDTNYIFNAYFALFRIKMLIYIMMNSYILNILKSVRKIAHLLGTVPLNDMSIFLIFYYLKFNEHDKRKYLYIINEETLFFKQCSQYFFL